LLIYLNITYGRVVYIVAHAEKPGDGKYDEKVGTTVSSMEGLGYLPDGLGYTGMIRAGCMMANFGPDAPYYRRPKRIITQHFILQNNGDFINNGKRGHHTSRRMYHQTYALALALGIDPDAEECCGGSYDDILKYIYTLPPEDDPILIVNQHGVCDSFIKAYAMSYGKKSDFEFFGKFADKVWTMIDGEFVEEWYMCCDEIAARCTDKSQQPAWVTANVPPQSPQKPPLKKGIEYPSYIYTPQNYGQSWNMNSYLRKRGLYSGEECFNQDLVQPFENITEYDLRNLEKRTDDSKKNENQNTNDKENSSIVNKINLLSISIAILLVTVFI
jgi:hypothetical protein